MTETSITPRLRVKGYVRVSTKKQDISPEMQAAKIQAYCELNDLELVDITEERRSAKDIKHRREFRRVLSDILTDKADSLVIYKLDRAFRSTRDALDTAEILNKQGKGLHSITEKLDTTSAMGEFIFTLLASLAQMERRLIGERTQAAMQQKKSNGEKVSREAPFGYRHEGKFVVEDEKEQSCIMEAQRLREEDPKKSLRNVARELAASGYRNRQGKTFHPECVKAMLGGSF